MKAKWKATITVEVEMDSDFGEAIKNDIKELLRKHPRTGRWEVIKFSNERLPDK